MRRYVFILAFFVLLGAPLLIRSLRGMPMIAGGMSGGSTGPRLVIITPHPADIRNEFRWAFADWHEKKYGECVDLQYLTPGGTNDIKRQLQTFYDQIRSTNHGELPPEEKINTMADLAWGGGDYLFNTQLKPLGVLRPLDLDQSVLDAAFPQRTLNGVNLLDTTMIHSKTFSPLWVGACLSSFGIVYNPDLYQSLGLAEPTTWADLATPKLFGNLSLADPTHSGSAAVAYLMVLQRAMADAEEAFFRDRHVSGAQADALKKTDDYQAAIDAGWKRGMEQLVLIAANARYFNDSATQPPTDVGDGDAAAGIAVDFYGHTTQGAVGVHREEFVMPEAATAITPDPIAILYGTQGKQLTLAQHFIEFLLSPEGQPLWILKPGEAGGPRQRPLWRWPVRRDVYDDESGWVKQGNYFTSAGGFNERGEWMAGFGDLLPMWGAAWIDSRDDLRNACEAILRVSDPAKREALLAELADIPISRPEMNAIVQKRANIEKDPTADANLWKANLRLTWARKFAEHYREVGAEAEAER